MELTDDEFESWCFRNGGETYKKEERPGVVCRFPDTATHDRVGYISSVGTFQIVTDGIFYRTGSVNQRANSWIDGEERLHVDTGDARVVVDPRR